MRGPYRSFVMFAVALTVSTVTTVVPADSGTWIGVARSADDTWILDEGGRVLKRVGQTSMALPGVRVPAAVDLTVDRSGNLVVAHNGSRGALLSIYDSSGMLLRSVEAATPATALRVVEGLRGATYLLTHAVPEGLQVKAFDRTFTEQAPIPVQGACPENVIDWPLAQLAVDRNGDLWVADVMACGSKYTIRKYAPEGHLLDTLIGTNGFTTAEADDSQRSNVMAVSDIFAADDAIYVVLGLSSPSGVLVDVWSLSGEYSHRAEVPGLRDSLVRGVVNDGTVTFVHLDEPNGAKTVPLASLRRREQP